MYLNRIIIFSLISALLLLSACNKEEDNNDTSLNYNKLAVGESANEFLSADEFDKLTIELIAVNNYQLDNSVVDSFKSFLNSRIHKPEGIIVRSSTVSSPGLAPYSAQDLMDFEDDNRTQYNDTKELTLFIFITGDKYTQEDVLGLAYRNTSFALMGGRIRELSGGIGEPSENLVLRTVLRHEIGHLLGLVAVGTPTQSDHQDEAHGHHCDVDGCLMYYTVETQGFLSDLVGVSEPPEFDSQCIADLQANGGK